MEIFPVTLSTLALGVSVFTFWWTNIREKRAFYLVRIRKLPPIGGVTFALVNGGKKDILITGLSFYFEGVQPVSRFYPAAKIEGGDAGKTDLISGGKAIEFHVSFVEPFSSTFAQQGLQANPWPDLHTHVGGIEISWVDMSAKAHTARVLHSRFGFTSEGKLQGIAPITEPAATQELYSAAP